MKIRSHGKIIGDIVFYTVRDPAFGDRVFPAMIVGFQGDSAVLCVHGVMSPLPMPELPPGVASQQDVAGNPVVVAQFSERVQHGYWTPRDMASDSMGITG